MRERKEVTLYVYKRNIIRKFKIQVHVGTSTAKGNGWRHLWRFFQTQYVKLQVHNVKNQFYK